jgi:glycosyltransferase involved in cell wall biosynthesis
MGAGRPVVSTPYTYARELLAEGRGILVEPGSPTHLAEALDRVLSDDALRADIGAKAHAYARRMIWSEVGVRYRRLFDRVATSARTGSATTTAAPARRVAIGV